MDFTHPIIEQANNSLEMPFIIEELQNLQQKEAEKRQHFYSLVHEDIKAEFINGEIVFQSPVTRGHWRISNKLSHKLQTFLDNNPIGEIGVEKVMIRCTRNDYEPDICFFGLEKSKTFTDKMLLFPPPDLAVEILSPSTATKDRTVKFQDYALNQIREYWLIDPEKQIIEQYVLPEGEKTYNLYAKLVQQGTIKSFVLQGFEVEISTLFGL